jgi:plastocyanin
MNRRLLPALFGVLWLVALALGTSRARASELRAFQALRPPVVLAHGDGDMDAGSPPPSGWHHFVHWVGHFHPAMTVFPIGMLLGAALAELLLITSHKPWLDGASRWCVIVGAIGAVITAPLGWAFAAGHGGSRLLEIHRWLGTTAAAGAVVILLLSERSHRPGATRWRTAFRTVLFLAVPLVAATGFFGGAMVYGVHEYDWNPPHHAHQGNDGGSHSAASQPGGAGATTVEMTDDATFKPSKIEVVVGSTVHWRNRSKDEHTVTDDPKVASDSKDVSMPAGAHPFNSGTIKPGGTYEQTFTIPGVYKYVCEPHEDMDMKGEVVVKAAH